MAPDPPAPDLDEDDDLALTRAILAGSPGASGRFAIRFREPLIGFLAARCDPKDGRSREQAVEIVDEMLAQCCHGDPGRNRGPLLAKFTGRGSLEGWLRRSVRCRMISWWRSLEYRSEVTESSLAASEEGERVLETRVAGEAGTVHTEPAVAEVLRDALLHAFDEAARQEPLGLIFLRLSTLYGVQKQRLAQAWQRDPAQAGRRIARALAIIRDEARDYVRGVDPWLDLEWSDFLQVFQVYPRILHGDSLEDDASDANDSESGV